MAIPPILIFNFILSGGVIVLFIAYLAGAIYGLGQMVQGLDREDLITDDSYSLQYLIKDKMFRNFPYRVQVSIQFLPGISYTLYSSLGEMPH